jgi:hypothetical protein
MPKQLPADTRVTYWADLRPSHTYQTPSEWHADEGKLCEVAAVVVTEFVATITTEPEPETLYYYQCLDANAAEISNWDPSMISMTPSQCWGKTLPVPRGSILRPATRRVWFESV